MSFIRRPFSASTYIVNPKTVSAAHRFTSALGSEQIRLNKKLPPGKSPAAALLHFNCISKLLAEISLQQAGERLAVAGFVAGHLVYGIVKE